MFQFRPFPSYAYLIQRTITEFCSAGFPHSEIHGYNGYLLLPVAYRSLSRPSSAPDAKAFPLRSFQLDRRRRGDVSVLLTDLWLEILVLYKNYAGNSSGFEIVIVTLHLLRCVPQLKLKPSVALLFTFSLFSFQGTTSGF